MLFPQQNQYRTIHDLGGYWRFLPDPDDKGEPEGWPRQGLPDGSMLIAVPGAWNEQLAERGLKNFIGAAWYETRFTSPRMDVNTQRLILRVGAADHHARVWVNDTFAGSHCGGYLPFDVDLTDAVSAPGGDNRLVICVDSRLTMETIPQGIDIGQPPYDRKEYDRRHVYPPARFDFFPYGGLTRSVQLLLVPVTRVMSLSVHTTLSGHVDVAVGASPGAVRGTVDLLDATGAHVAGVRHVQFSEGRATCALEVASPRSWFPASPYLYTVVVRLLDASGSECDSYNQTFGIREVKVDGGTLLLNGEPVYLVGFGKHEEFPIVGRGQFRPAYLRDFELMRWAGANSFRTSHYPYDEEVLQLADQLGFLVISEAPAVSLGFLSGEFDDLQPLLTQHRQALTELVARDSNHPSVIAWSPMNEPNLWSEPQYQNDASRRYFRAVYDHLRSLDSTRPSIAITMAAFTVDDVALDACDMIGINRYYGWYTEPGELGKARKALEREMDLLYERYGKPVMITECGVDTVEGLHASTPQMFTEEFQIEFLRTYASVADEKHYCAGFHVWNFADFLTPQHHRRVVLNRKGVFTRDRDPKSAAFFLRSHWTALTRIASNHRPSRFDTGFLVGDVHPAGE
jgi:beta-glucuronidase